VGRLDGANFVELFVAARVEGDNVDAFVETAIGEMTIDGLDEGRLVGLIVGTLEGKAVGGYVS
jgi:hypothetical protein